LLLLLSLYQTLRFALLSVTPSGELKVELFTTIGLDAVLVLETPSNGTGSNRQIPVVCETSGFPSGNHICEKGSIERTAEFWKAR
jgi:hypothetical protein